MVEKFQNKYRIASARLQSWDYGRNGSYFVSICTKDREYYFGDIIEGKMQLSEIGKIAQKYWFEIPDHFPFVILDEFVVMPNHLHGIVVINHTRDTLLHGKTRSVDTLHATYLRNETYQQDNATHLPKNKKMQAISPKYGELSTIIRSYKSAITKDARKWNPNFAWQSRFHDHIIRNNVSYQNIRNYIINNPKKWQEENK
jgi:putative transposase